MWGALHGSDSHLLTSNAAAASTKACSTKACTGEDFPTEKEGTCQGGDTGDQQNSRAEAKPASGLEDCQQDCPPKADHWRDQTYYYPRRRSEAKPPSDPPCDPPCGGPPSEQTRQERKMVLDPKQRQGSTRSFIKRGSLVVASSQWAWVPLAQAEPSQ